MKKNKLLPFVFYHSLLITGLILTSNGYSQLTDFSNTEVIYSENFNTGIPDDFIVLDRDNAYTHYPDVPQDTVWYWNATNDGGQISVVSYFTDYIAADDWIILPGITIEDSTYLYWEAQSMKNGYLESYDVLISTSEPDPDAFDPAQFNLLLTVTYENIEMTGHSINLDDAGYKDQKVWIAFHSITLSGFILNMDNFYLCTFNTKDCKIVDYNPNASLVPGDPLTINYKMVNMGMTCGTVKLCWKEDGSATIHQLNLPGNGFGELSAGVFPDEFVSSTPGEKTIKIWIDEVDGMPDVNQTNDTVQFYVEIVDDPVSRKILMEEFTGTWCNMCPDGARMIDTLLELHPEVFPVAVHAYDLLEIPEGAELADYTQSSFPQATMNRLIWEGAIVHSKLDSYDNFIWDDYCNYLINHVPVSIGILAYSEYDNTNGMIHARVDVNFTRSKHGNYRFNLYVVEDSITGFPQRNVYNTISGHPLFGLGDPIEDYVHNHVLRKMVGGVWGEQGSVSNPALGEYSHTFTFMADPWWNMEHISLIATISEYDSAGLNREIINAADCKPFSFKFYSQNDELITDDHVVISAKSSVSEADFMFKIKNNTASPVDAKMKIQKLSGNRDHTQYICWDNCYPGDVLETGTVPVGADTFSIFSASLHAEPHALTGTDEFLITVYDIADPDIKKELYLTFQFYYYTDIEISQTDPSVSGTKLFPNPSDGLIHINFRNNNASPTQLRITVFSPLGQVITMQEDFTDDTGQWTGTLNFSDLMIGLYYYTIETSTIKKTGKFIITR